MSEIYQAGDYVAIHQNPIWHDKSDFIIRAYLGESEGRNEWEQIWAKKLNEKKFLVCCIPFFSYNIALGDEVETDENYTIHGVTKSSKYFTCRIWFNSSSGSKVKDKVTFKLEKMDVLLEWASSNLLALSPNGVDQNRKVLSYLKACQDADELIYESG